MRMNEDDMQIGLGLMLTLVSRGFEPYHPW